MRDEAANAHRMAESGRHFRVPLELSGALLVTGDVVAVCLAGIPAGLMYQEAYLGIDGDLTTVFGTNLLLASFLVLAQGFRNEASHAALSDLKIQLVRLTTIWLLAHLFLFLFVFLMKANAVSRGSVLASFLVGWVALLAVRTLVHRAILSAIDSGFVQSRRVAVFSNSRRYSLVDDLRKLGYRVVRQFSTLGEYACADADRVKADVADTIETLRRLEVEEIFISTDWRNCSDIEPLLEGLRATPVRVRLLPDQSTRTLLSKPVSKVGNMCAVELQREPLSGAERSLKRALDLVIAATALVLLAPLLFLTALAIKLDSRGPVFFRQTRIGFNGKPFRILKFRTMTVLEDGAQIRQASVNDDRVTFVGRFLRRSSIDELPQLFNVFRGEMSLVGPRPHARAHDDEYSRKISNYAFRHNVKPGITGWAQIRGCRGETRQLQDMQKRIELDIWYIDNWSAWLDLKIMLVTALKLCRMPDAY